MLAPETTQRPRPLEPPVPCVVPLIPCVVPLEGTSALRPIFWWPRKKMADLDLPHRSQEECVPRGVGKVSPYFEVDGSIFGLGFTHLHDLATVLSNQPKIRPKLALRAPRACPSGHCLGNWPP